jgi:hypothetical protein
MRPSRDIVNLDSPEELDQVSAERFIDALHRSLSAGILFPAEIRRTERLILKLRHSRSP